MALIELENITKTYGKGEAAAKVLEDISLKIEAGEFVAIVGASGSGKTTLMNIIGLLDRAGSGRYMLDGQEVSRLKERALAARRRETIGFIFQNFNLLPRLSAVANVELPMIYRKFKSGPRHLRAQKLLGIMGLSDRLHHRPNQLSGGQMQRVAIARALANQPKLILADEPTGNLDQKTGAQVLHILKKLNQRGTTLIVVTHNPEVAAAANRLIVMRDGVLTERAQR